MTTPDVALVPPRRLGTVLCEARTASGATHVQLAERSDRFSAEDLAAIEAGEWELFDADLVAIAGVYGLDAGHLVPERSRLVIDLDERRIAAGPHEHPISAPTADEVLATYLSLVYTMRHATPGTPVSLRQTDIDVLSRALEIASNDVATRLVDLMADPGQVVTRKQGWWRSRVLLPVAGVVVAATAIGTIVLVSQRNGVESTPGVATGDLPATTIVAVAPTASLIDPIVVERNPDGTPGPAHVPGQPPVGDGLVPGQTGASPAALAPAQVVERNADGTAGAQVDR